MSKPKNKRPKKPDNTFSDKELNIISFFGVFISSIAYFVYNWQGLIVGALAGIVMGVFFIRWYRKRSQEKNQNELKT
jgi:hypothetical protein